MHQCHQRVFKHFLLPESKKQEILHPFGPVGFQVFVFANQNIAADGRGFFPKYKCGCCKEDKKRKLGNHKMLFKNRIRYLFEKVCVQILMQGTC